MDSEPVGPNSLEVGRTKLGEMLVEAKHLTPDQLKVAKDFQRTVGGNLGAIVVKLGFIEDEVLTQFIAKSQGLPVADLENLVLPENLVRRLPRKIIEEHEVIPISFKDGVLTVAMSDPTDLEAIDNVSLATEARVEVKLASRLSVQKAINSLFYAEDSPFAKAAATAAAPGAGAPTKEALLKALESGKGSLEDIARRAGLPSSQVLHALVPLLIDKGIIKEEELVQHARHL